jgi:hypothetical protein
MDDDMFIKELEEKLLSSEVRRNREELERLISPDFIEYGSSGKIYNYFGTIAHLLANSGDLFDYAFVNFKTRRLSEDIILALYILETEKNRRIIISNRSSLWRWEVNAAGKDAAWRLIFHQGTRATR